VLDDSRNAELLRRVNASGEIFISHAVLAGRYVLRLAVGGMFTAEADIDRAWAALRGCEAELPQA
jgi:aromatic-L-amino-acid decarboxylase